MSKSKTKTAEKLPKYFYLANPDGKELYGKTRFEESDDGYLKIEAYIYKSSVPLCALKESEKGHIWDEDPDKEGFFYYLDNTSSVEDPEMDVD